jgi:hypothetical protein
VTIHYIGHNWNLEYRTLGVKGLDHEAHTAEFVKQSFLEVLDEYDFDVFRNSTLPHPQYFGVTDNGSNMAAANGISTLMTRITCADHKISTVVTTALNKRLGLFKVLLVRHFTSMRNNILKYSS